MILALTPKEAFSIFSRFWTNLGSLKRVPFSVTFRSFLSRVFCCERLELGLRMRSCPKKVLTENVVW